MLVVVPHDDAGCCGAGVGAGAALAVRLDATVRGAACGQGDHHTRAHLHAVELHHSTGADEAGQASSWPDGCMGGRGSCERSLGAEEAAP